MQNGEIFAQASVHFPFYCFHLLSEVQTQMCQKTWQRQTVDILVCLASIVDIQARHASSGWCSEPGCTSEGWHRRLQKVDMLGSGVGEEGHERYHRNSLRGCLGNKFASDP